MEPVAKATGSGMTVKDEIAVNGASASAGKAKELRGNVLVQLLEPMMGLKSEELASQSSRVVDQIIRHCRVPSKSI